MINLCLKKSGSDDYSNKLIKFETLLDKWF